MPIKSVLLIDDDKDDHDLFKIMLEGIDPAISFTACDNGPEALENLNRSGYMAPDIIFLDMKMPGMNGLEFLTRFQNTNLSIPVIVFSTSASGEEFDLCKELGVQYCFEKPANLQRFTTLLSQIIQNH